MSEGGVDCSLRLRSACFEQYPYFSARCFERQGGCERLVSSGGVSSLRRQAAERLLRCRSSRLIHNNTQQTVREEGGREAEKELWAGNLEIYGAKMTMSVPERKSGSEGKEEESEDESEILEESPCGRWQKRKEQVGRFICVPLCVCERVS